MYILLFQPPDTSHIFYHLTECFKKNCFDEMCVAATIGRITSNTICFEGIPLVFIKFFLPLILLMLTQLFKYIFTFSIFPLVWKISDIVSIPKVNSSLKKFDNRPTFILLVTAQLLLMWEFLMIFAWVWSWISQQFLFCFLRLSITYAINCSFINCDNVMPFISLILSFSSASKGRLWWRFFFLVLLIHHSVFLCLLMTWPMF
jgi:hypothetical protein